ncbi:MAG: amino acid-binding protein [Clostridiales bacterium]|nr:amino acid-binding protein [Clostridiales bacterium]MBQ8352262.1 amino acid-binding protein [Clostridia bacterium]
MIKQIAVFLENKEGKASACCKLLKEAGVNLYAISIADTTDFGILRLITADNALALSTLKGAGYIASEVELVGIEVPDKAGALADVLIALGEARVNVEYMYSYAEVDGHAKIALKTAAPQMAISVLEDLGAKIL